MLLRPQLLGIWLLLHAAGTSEPLSGGRRNALSGRHLRIAVAESFTGVMLKRDANGKVVGYSGPMYEFVDWLSSSLKFTYTLVPTTYNFDPLPNGTWIGGYSLLFKQEVDFVFAPTPTTPGMFVFSDFTASVGAEPLVILVPAPKEKDRISAIIKPFSWKVWLLFIVSALCVVLTIQRLSKNNQAETLRTRVTTTNDLVMCTLRVIVGQGGFEGSSFSSFRKRLPLSGWLLTTLILVSCYNGTFISYATAPQFMPQVETLEDLTYSNDLQPLVLRSQTESFYTNPTTETFRILGNRFRGHPENMLSSPADSFGRVSSGCCAFIYYKFLLEYYLYQDFIRTGECRCSITTTPHQWHHVAFGAQKNHPYTTTISKEILVAKETGVVNYWFKDKVTPSYKCSKSEKPKRRPLTLKDFSGAFILLFCGIGLGFLVFVCEVISGKPKKTGRC